MARKRTNPRSVETLTHEGATRKNIPTAEYQPLMVKEDKDPLRIAYERRNRDLDPQLVWRGKDEQDWSDLVVHAPPLYIQEKVHPKVLIDDLIAASKQATSHKPPATQPDLFADFNGIPDEADRTDFYRHDANWTNRMILGDSLQVMASLAEREGLRGKVQCIYIDPPYGIKFNSNFQWSTTSRDVKDGKAEHITREPEQVKAFRDTWRDGIHSYLTYLRDRLTVARDLLTESGSIFVQIGDENVHRVRALMDEVFGEDNCCAQIAFVKTSGLSSNFLADRFDYLLWYARDKKLAKYRQLYGPKSREDGTADTYSWLRSQSGDNRSMSAAEKTGKARIPEGFEPYKADNITSQGNPEIPFSFEGKKYRFRSKTTETGLTRLGKAHRLHVARNSLQYVRTLHDFPVMAITQLWSDTGTGSFTDKKIYVVQTGTKTIERCILMATDPGDLVLDPTCGSGTTAYVAEQWGRRWITIDTSRVALALARARIMGARYPYYLLADSPEGRLKEAEVGGGLRAAADLTANHQSLTTNHHYDIRQGFVYERVPHITLKSIANNAEIDVIWEKWQQKIAPLLEELNRVVSGQWRVISGDKKPFKPMEEWEIPRERPRHWSQATDHLLKQWWELRIARQKEIDASIAAKADFEYLYDKSYPDKTKVRVAGPFTVESLSPHRVLSVDENDELIDGIADPEGAYDAGQDFVSMILENLKTAGVQQAHKEDRITFTSITPWPGDLVCAEGRFVASGEWLVSGDKGQAPSHESQVTERRAGIFIGPEFGTVSRPDLVEAARETADAGFDVLIACAFNYEAHATEFSKLGRIPVLKARMNADLHMADDLKNTGKGNLFVVFGEPDVEVDSDLWLVTRHNQMVASYEQVKELSGLGNLEEINRLGRDDLSRLKKFSAGGEVRHDQPDSPGGHIGSGEYRGGRSEDGDRRVSAQPERGERIAGGGGNADHPGAAASDTGGGEGSPSARAGGRNQQDAGRSQAIAAIEELTEGNFPLSLTTSHYAQVTIHGVDVFHPNSGEVRSDGPEGIACWFIDTDYNGESFFVRHAYFLGANDPYKALKTTLRAEIDEDAWETLHSDTSRPFPKPQSGRIAVKVINHLGDEVMKVFRVGSP